MRDKYVSLALRRKSSDYEICILRLLQDKAEKIPPAVLKRELERQGKVKDPLQRARFLAKLGRYEASAVDYLDGIGAALKEKRFFSAAYYLKELKQSMIGVELFVLALKEAAKSKDLWWQIRSLQELGWRDELHDLVKSHKDEITKSGNVLIQCRHRSPRVPLPPESPVPRDPAGGSGAVLRLSGG